jgi:hypothetical protein
MNTTTLKRITKDEVETASILIASRWLNSAECIIASGERPAKLSEIVNGSVAGLYEPDAYLADRKFNHAANERIAKGAIRVAAEFLNNGDYPLVLAFFKNAAK